MMQGRSGAGAAGRQQQAGVRLGLLPVLPRVTLLCIGFVCCLDSAVCVCVQGGSRSSRRRSSRRSSSSKGSSSSGSTRIRSCLSLYLALCSCLIGASCWRKLGTTTCLPPAPTCPSSCSLFASCPALPCPGKLTAAGPSVAYFLQPSDDAVPLPAANLKCNLIQIQLA